MIFVTVGAQMPFDRLTSAVDRWAGAHGRTDVFAQIGVGGRPLQHVEWTELLEPAEFERRLAEADLLVAHAGTGSFISAMQAKVPLIALARESARRETRNDHQLAMAQRFAGRSGLYVAADTDELVALLDRTDLEPPDPIGTEASPELIERIRGFIIS